jgi:hypothetical protein
VLGANHSAAPRPLHRRLVEENAWLHAELGAARAQVEGRGSGGSSSSPHGARATAGAAAAAGAEGGGRPGVLRPAAPRHESPPLPPARLEVLRRERDALARRVAAAEADAARRARAAGAALAARRAAAAAAGGGWGSPPGGPGAGAAGGSRFRGTLAAAQEEVRDWGGATIQAGRVWGTLLAVPWAPIADGVFFPTVLLLPRPDQQESPASPADRRARAGPRQGHATYSLRPGAALAAAAREQRRPHDQQQQVWNSSPGQQQQRQQQRQQHEEEVDQGPWRAEQEASTDEGEGEGVSCACSPQPAAAPPPKPGARQQQQQQQQQREQLLRLPRQRLPPLATCLEQEPEAAPQAVGAADTRLPAAPSPGALSALADMQRGLEALERQLAQLQAGSGRRASARRGG